MTAHAYDYTAARWITPYSPPAFIALAKAECDVTDGTDDYRAYFTLHGWGNECASLVGVIRYGGDEAEYDAAAALARFGMALILRWEGQAPVWGDDETDPREQAGYDAAKEASYAR